jgi:hypothetical protein
MGSGLHDHLVDDHGRTSQELAGLPLADVHRFEHLEQSLGLVRLDHVHADRREPADELIGGRA